MPRSNLSLRLKDGIGNLAVVAGVVGSLLPGTTYFLNAAPPMFSVAALLSTGVAVAVFVRVFVMRPRVMVAAKRGAQFVVCAAMIGALYGLLLPLLTVTSPPFAVNVERYQIGFRTLEFSLTPEAASKRRQLGLRTPEELMLAFGGYEPSGTFLIWRAWTIVLAGSLLIVLYVVSFLLWAHGLALLAWSLKGEARLH
jgi:hypothetical protein